MKKQILLALALIASAGITQADGSSTCCGPSEVSCQPVECCACTVKSHTFFSVRPLFQVASPEYETLFRDRIHARPEGKGGAIQLVPFGSHSSEPYRIATFFTPVCKSTLKVAELESENPDVLAGYFNIATVSGNFKSFIQFCPSRTETGLGIAYEQCLYEKDDGRCLWLTVTGPITNVHTRMKMIEQVISTGGGKLAPDSDPLIGQDGSTCNNGTASCCAIVPPVPVDAPVATMTDAFNQPQWRHGKIDCRCSMERTRLANLDILIGFETIKRDECYAESYFGITIPTGNRVGNVHVFEPMVGNNHHFGIQFGTNLGLQFWASEDEQKSLCFDLSARAEYLIRNCQNRLVDLKFKPWSRYMEVYFNQAQAQQAADAGDRFLATPGVDVFALDMRVHPGLQRTYNTALSYTTGKFQIEGGYNFYWREKECLELKCPWQEGPALKAPNAAGVTNSVQMINHFYACNDEDVASYNDNLIQQRDLDLDSAAHPAIVSHTLYASAGWRFDDREFPPIFGVGGSYEFANDNTVLDRWTFWAKTGFSF